MRDFDGQQQMKTERPPNKIIWGHFLHRWFSHWSGNEKETLLAINQLQKLEVDVLWTQTAWDQKHTIYGKCNGKRRNY